MEIKRKTFGVLSNGKKVKLYTLRAGDLQFSLTNYGAGWTSLIVPSRKGGASKVSGTSKASGASKASGDDVLLGYSGLEGYLNNGPYIGVTVGRFANRIARAAFSLNGKQYQLEANDGKNTLHSGSRGFAQMLWKSETFEENDAVFVRFELESPDGDCGFPGNLKAVVTYGLTKSNEIIADYRAKCDAPSPVNLTNHAYFNLAGEGKGSILNHELRLHSSHFVKVDRRAIPKGFLAPVKGTAFDFTTRRRIEKSYDHCFAVDGEIGKLRPCAEVYENESGRSMKVYTTQPGVQFYTGNYLKDVAGKHGSRYAKHSGFCLETQHFPDTPNQISFPSCIASAGKDYHEKAVFAFGF